MHANILKKMRLILALLFFAGFQTACADGYGEWKFGMTRDEVRAVSGFEPYYSLPNNDLGSQSAPLADEHVPISFYFVEDKLSRMMLIAYQGENMEEAKKAWQLSIGHLADNFEGIELGTNQGVSASVEAAVSTLDGNLEGMPSNTRVQVGVFPMPSTVRVWATFTKAKDSLFMVAVNYASP